MIRSYVELIRDERPALLFGVGCAFLSSPGQTFFISLFIGAISASLGLGSAQLGSLYLVATLGAASLLPLTGHWLDRVDLRRYALFVAGGLAAGCGVMAIADGPIGVLFGFMLLRLTGQGLMTHVAVTSIARYFNRQRGRALSVVAMGFPLAEGIMPAIAVAMIAALGWRMSYALIGALVLAVAAPILIRLIWRVPSFTRPPGWERPGRAPLVAWYCVRNCSLKSTIFKTPVRTGTQNQSNESERFGKESHQACIQYPWSGSNKIGAQNPGGFY
jgi:MFS family permease